jgi:hypothetical protein
MYLLAVQPFLFLLYTVPVLIVLYLAGLVSVTIFRISLKSEMEANTYHELYRHPGTKLNIFEHHTVSTGTIVPTMY